MSIMTSLDNDITQKPIVSEPVQKKNENPEIEDPTSNHSSHSQQSNASSEQQQQYCQTCQTEFNDRSELLKHLLNHVKLPNVVLQRCDDPVLKKKALTHKCGPLRFSIKTTNNNFQIIKSPENPDEITRDPEDRPPIPKLRILLPEQVSETFERKTDHSENKLKLKTSGITITEVIDNPAPVSNGAAVENKETKMVELHSLPNESQSPSFPGPSPTQPDINTDDNNSFWNSDQTNEDPLRITTESGEKEAETHNSLLQNFLNDTVESIPKDAGINSNENEYISLERLAEKNGPKCPVCDALCLDKQSLEVHQKAMGHYLPTIDTNSSSSSVVPYRQNSLGSINSSNPLESLANLPMQQLAQQVNRLQQGPVHQQNVLINIQQFGQPMGHPQYGRPPEIPTHYPAQHFPTPPQPPQSHMYGGYHHPPAHPDFNHPMYYPQTPGIYPSMQIPSQMPSQMSHQNNRPGQPPHPHPYHNQTQNTPHHNSSQPHQTSMMPPRAPPPQPQSQSRMAPPPNPGQQQMRPRARMPAQQRPNAPRMTGARPMNASGIRPNMSQQQIRPVRRIVPAPNNNSEPQIKRKRMDVLIPDTNDNDDCHVISMQKCNDGMPIIKNIQGANTSSNTSSSSAASASASASTSSLANGSGDVDPIVHLTDSITLSVRNPKEPQAAVVQQKKNDAKAVANILATRGITVTPAAKTQKEQAETPPKKPTPPPAPVAINLNSAVSIIPTARQQQQQQQQQQPQQQQHHQQNGQSHSKQNNHISRTPTVDLTDDEPIQQPPQQQQQQQQHNTTNKSTGATVSKRTLPHQCDLCPAQYPTLQSLMNHRRTYHKTGTPSELGVPVVDLRQAQVLGKLAAIGIHNYIPLPQLGNGTGNFALPIVSVNASKNPNICNLGALGSGAVLPLGPLRHISNLPNGK